MQELIKQMTSPSWWLGVVIVGILINLVAAYLKPRIDRILGFVSGRYRRRNERQAKARAEQIETLHSDQHEQIMFAVSINYQLLHAIYLMFIAFLLLIVAFSLLGLGGLSIIFFFLFIIGALAFIMGIWEQMEVISDCEILREARKSPTQEIKKTVNRGII